MPQSTRLTPLEFEIMSVLWEPGRPMSRPSSNDSSAILPIPPSRRCSTFCTGKRR